MAVQKFRIRFSGIILYLTSYPCINRRPRINGGGGRVRRRVAGGPGAGGPAVVQKPYVDMQTGGCVQACQRVLQPSKKWQKLGEVADGKT